MSQATKTRTIWVAYGSSGVVGTIRKEAKGYTVTMAGADTSTGEYPSMEVAKAALFAQMRPGSDWPVFREH
ncbi:MAG TPA: methyltransferase [Microbacterium sp.]|nr:methyltransferase [Microbacterium sp.]